MANKQGGLLATLGKRMLGFGASSSSCCAAPGEVAETSDHQEAAETSPEVNTPKDGCCSPASRASSTSGPQDAPASA